MTAPITAGTQVYASSHAAGGADDVDALIEAIITSDIDTAVDSGGAGWRSTGAGADTAGVARHGWWLHAPQQAAVEAGVSAGDEFDDTDLESLWPLPEWTALRWLEPLPAPTLPALPLLSPPVVPSCESSLQSADVRPVPFLAAPRRHNAELLVAAAAAPYALSYDPLAGPVLQAKSGFDIADSVLAALASPGALAELLAYFAERGITPAS